MGTLGTLAVSIIGDSRDLDKTLSSTQQTMHKFGDGMFKAGLAITGVGAAAMALGKQVEPLNQSIDRTAALTGESSDSLRDLALSLTDASFPLEDVTRGMEHLVEKGIETKEGMEAILPALDAFADATGKDIVESIDLFDTVLSALNIPLEEAGEHIDTMTYIVEQTNIPLGTLQRNLARVPEELQALGFGLDESTAAIEWFTDQGYSGQEAVREFRRAVAESEGDMDMFLEITGMTAAELENYQESIAGAAGLTDELAEINNRSITIFDNLKQRFQEVIFEHGELIEKAGQLGQVMTAVGPIMAGAGKGIAALTKSTLLQTTATKAMTVAKTVGATALKAFGVALKLALGPIGLVILAIGALVVAGIYLYKNWDEVVAWLTDLWEKFVAHIKAKVDETVQFFKDLIAFFRGIFTGDMQLILESLHHMFIAIFGEKIANVLMDFVDLSRDIIDRVIKFFQRLPGELLNIGRRMIENLARGIRERIGQVTGAIGNVASTVRDWLPFSPAKLGPLRKTPDFTSHLVDPAKEALRELEAVMQSGMTKVGMAVPGVAAPVSAGSIPAGDTISNHFTIQQANIRDDSDIEKLAEKLYELQRKRRRGS